MLTNFLQKREPGEAKIEIDVHVAKRRPPNPAPIFTKSLNNDKTFLVDSVLAEVSRLGYKVYEIYHPVVKALPRQSRQDSSNSTPDAPQS